MAEYIDRESAIESLPVAWDSAVNALRNAPAADVAPVVHGRWVVHKTATGRAYTLCSRCNSGLANYDKGGISEPLEMRGAKYCPNCGAKMDGGDSDG